MLLPMWNTSMIQSISNLEPILLTMTINRIIKKITLYMVSMLTVGVSDNNPSEYFKYFCVCFKNLTWFMIWSIHTNKTNSNLF